MFLLSNGRLIGLLVGILSVRRYSYRGDLMFRSV